MAQYLTIEALLERVREQAIAAGSLRKYASSIGISAPYLSDVMNRRRDPGPTICKALGYEAVILYREVP